jgi:hypothetical protein
MDFPASSLAYTICLRQLQSHIGWAWVWWRTKSYDAAKPVRVVGADGVSQGGGGAIHSSKKNQALVPPEDMEPSARAALAGV